MLPRHSPNLASSHTTHSAPAPLCISWLRGVVFSAAIRFQNSAPHKPLVDHWLTDDPRNNRKQRHTAKRLHDRLVEECGADVSVSTVGRYVRTARGRMSTDPERYLDLAWPPGEAQADFDTHGVRTRPSYLVLTLPFSNSGLAQVFPGENVECACQALRNIFVHLGGIPREIVFGNAAGVGRRVGDAAGTTELFEACSAHTCSVAAPTIPAPETRGAAWGTRWGQSAGTCSFRSLRSGTRNLGAGSCSTGAWRWRRSSAGSRANWRSSCSCRTPAPYSDCPPSPSGASATSPARSTRGAGSKWAAGASAPRTWPCAAAC